MTPSNPSPEWLCSWEAHEREQLRYGRSLTLLQKLQWLEEATEFAKNLQAAKRRPVGESSPEAEEPKE